MRAEDNKESIKPLNKQRREKSIIRSSLAYLGAYSHKREPRGIEGRNSFSGLARTSDD
jgi:hypothetical protein